jgi:cyclophilin family peptidyl-prolyl cis-trans isomerase
MRYGPIHLATLLLVVLPILGCNSGDADDPAVTASIGEKPDSDGGGSDSRDAASKDQQDPNHPLVRISTTAGDILVKLDAENAPITVKNFLWYAGNSHYDGTIFHQVLEGYVVLGGGYTPDLTERPTHFTIRNEAYNELKNTRGSIAMARQPDVIDSSTCQFFFNLVDNPKLDHKSRTDAKEFGYCVFGHVVDGMELLDKMSQAPVTDKADFASVPVEPVVINSVAPVQ